MNNRAVTEDKMGILSYTTRVPQHDLLSLSSLTQHQHRQRPTFSAVPSDNGSPRTDRILQLIRITECLGTSYFSKRQARTHRTLRLTRPSRLPSGHRYHVKRRMEQPPRILRASLDITYCQVVGLGHTCSSFRLENDI